MKKLRCALLPAIAVALAISFAGCDTGTTYRDREVERPLPPGHIVVPEDEVSPAFITIPGAVVNYLLARPHGAAGTPNAVAPGFERRVVFVMDDIILGHDLLIAGTGLLPPEGGTFALMNAANRPGNLPVGGQLVE